MGLENPAGWALLGCAWGRLGRGEGHRGGYAAGSLEGHLGRPHFRRANESGNEVTEDATRIWDASHRFWHARSRGFGPERQKQQVYSPPFQGSARHWPRWGWVGRGSHRTWRQTDRKPEFVCFQCTGIGPRRNGLPSSQPGLLLVPLALEKALEASKQLWVQGGPLLRPLPTAS